jgi:Protein of unknown function (DUF3485)
MTQPPMAEVSINAAPQEPRAAGYAKFVWIALVAVALLQGAAFALERLWLPSTVRPMRHQLSELPLTIGNWTGKSADLDPRIFVKLETDDLVNRSYANPGGDAIAVHCAAWLSTAPGMPHSPEECYTTNGWKRLEGRTATLPGHPDVSVALQKYARADQHIVLIFWYQMDDHTFLDWNGARRVHRLYRGRREWPPLTKTLLQIDESETAEASLLEIAPVIYELTRKL